MSKSSFVDFPAVKAAITMEQVLQHYGLLHTFKERGEGLTGPCPIHKGHNPTQFRVSLTKNIWNCFSECKHGGNTLDFIARMEDVSIHAAALKAVTWFGLDPDEMKGDEDDDTPEEPKRNVPAQSKTQTQVEEPIEPNKPLKFRLDKLDTKHPYLAQRGLSPETIIDFGLGFCSKGMMAGRIAIPIHNVAGEIVAYSGRFPGEPAEDTPKYKLPPGFRKSQEIFNLDRACKEPTEQPLIVVEGFFGCMNLWQHGYRKVVALMGSTMSAVQEDLIRLQVHCDSRVLVVFDEDEAGRAGREDLAVRLSRFCFVKIHRFTKENSQPDQLSAQEVRSWL